MRGGITAVAALVLLGALWFLAGDDDGRNAVPRLFDNMNDRPLADAQQVGISSAAPDRKARLTPPRSVAQSLGINGTVRKREDDRDSFAAEGSYFSSGRMQGGEEDSMPLELGGISRSRDVQAEGRALYLAHCAVCHGEDGSGRGSMAAYETYPQIGSFRDEKYASYSSGKMFRSIRLGQGNMPAFGNILTAREIWPHPARECPHCAPRTGRRSGSRSPCCPRPWIPGNSASLPFCFFSGRSVSGSRPCGERGLCDHPRMRTDVM